MSVIVSMSNIALCQEFYTLNGVMPLTFTSTGIGNYDKSVIYHGATTGLLFDLAKTSNSRSATPIDFMIDARGGGHNFFTIKGSNGNVGIGTTSPIFKLHIKGNVVAEGDGAGNYADFNLKNGSVRWHISGPRYGESNRLGIFWNDGSAYYDHFTITTTGNVGIGTSSPDAKLAVKGQIHSQEVKVDLQGAAAPDYVFDKTYDLMKLSDIEEYINKNKHLPNIPSAKEIGENGLELGKMEMKLLEKIEELTLHMIELKKEMDELKGENRKLKEEIIKIHKE